MSDPTEHVRPRVALLTSVFFPTLGGVQVGLHNIAMRLLARGYDPVVIAPFGASRFRERASLPYRVHVLPPKFFSLFRFLPASVADRCYSWLYSLLQWRYDFTVWHITMGYPTWASFAYFAKRSGARYLVRCAGEDIQKLESVGYGARNVDRLDRVIRERLPQCETLIAISESVASEYYALGIEEEQIERIPNGVACALFQDVNTSRQQVRDRLGIPVTDLLLLAVGRNHPKKNFVELPKIAAKLREQRDDFTILVVGNDTEVLREALPRDLLRHVRCLPGFGMGMQSHMPVVPHPDLAAIYCASDIFLFPSLIETFGIVIVEAMAAGLPIITSNVPGCRDLVEDGKHGILCEPTDTDAFVNAVMRLSSDNESYKAMALANRQHALHYDWDAVVDQYVALYDRLRAG